MIKHNLLVTKVGEEDSDIARKVFQLQQVKFEESSSDEGKFPWLPVHTTPTLFVYGIPHEGLNEIKCALICNPRVYGNSA